MATQLIEVAFKGNRKEFFLWDTEEPPRLHASVIVEADRGEDLGRIHSVGDLAEHRCSGCSHGCGSVRPERKVLRNATADEERRAADIRGQDEDTRRKVMEKVKQHGLIMKVSDAEWQWDRRKLTIYFTAERRVDFRALVRDLAAAFRTRIELKQIGVRDEAKRLSGIGRCGREYCSASWLPELRPVNLQVAKDQRLSLNPSQISGACGRLMCCLRYEHEFYVQSRRKYPKEGKIVKTATGEEKVIANDIFRERVTLRSPEGEMRTILLTELRDEMTAAGDPLINALEAAARETTAIVVPDDLDEPMDLDAAVTEERPIVRVAPPTRSAPRSAPPSAPAPAPAPSPMAASVPAEGSGAPEGEKRTQRRRGRRGGRRNRPSGGTTQPPAPDDASRAGDDGSNGA